MVSKRLAIGLKGRVLIDFLQKNDNIFNTVDIISIPYLYRLGEYISFYIIMMHVKRETLWWIQSDGITKKLNEIHEWNEYMCFKS